MAATDAQQSCLADAEGFQAAVRASIMKKALSIIENPGSYTAGQLARAKSISQGQSMTSYYQEVASSTNVIASNITYDFVNRTVVSDISDAALDSQVATTVFTDLV